MRAAIVAATFALFGGSPVIAQCVYVACSGGGQAVPPYQHRIDQVPVYQMPSQITAVATSARGYDEGYSAGLAARPRATYHVIRPAASTARPKARATSHARAAVISPRRTSMRTAMHASRPRTHAAAAVQKHSNRATPIRRVAMTHPQARHTGNGSHYSSNFQDPIKDRATSYQSSAYGQTISMASTMTRSSSYSSSYSGSGTTSWSGPASGVSSSVVNQNGYVCGWGSRIGSNSHGHAQQQAVWVCHYPHGWRPPGY